MRIVWLIVLVLASSSVTAEDENPFLSLSAPELRTRIAAVDEFFKEQSWYQVEIIAFARKQSVSDEYWRLDRRPELDANAAITPGLNDARLPQQADEVDSRAAANGAWRWLDAEQLQLSDTVQRMERDGDYRILLHGAWRQPMRERGRAFPVLLKGGDALPPATAPVAANGSTQNNAPLAPRTAPALNPTLEYEAGEDGDAIRSAPLSEPEFQATLRLHLARYLHVEPDAWLARDSDDGQRYWVQIDQKRRMRGEELHYLDHPLFGLLLRMTPWQTPEQKELEQLEKALKAK